MVTGRSVPNRFEDEYGAPLACPIPSRVSGDHEPDLYEGRHRAFEDEQERRYLLEGPSAIEEFNSGAGWYG